MKFKGVTTVLTASTGLKSTLPVLVTSPVKFVMSVIAVLLKTVLSTSIDAS